MDRLQQANGHFVTVLAVFDGSCTLFPLCLFALMPC